MFFYNCDWLATSILRSFLSRLSYITFQQLGFSLNMEAPCSFKMQLPINDYAVLLHRRPQVVKSANCWDITPYSSVEVHQQHEWICCHHCPKCWCTDATVCDVISHMIVLTVLFKVTTVTKQMILYPKLLQSS